MNAQSYLPLDRLARLDNFGHSMTSVAYLYRPTHPAQVAELFEIARKQGSTVTFRGSGRSYGDASLNAGRVIVDLRRMNRILDWNPATGVITCQPGVTIEQLWKYIIEDGWWPPVVPGTMFPTLGGVLGVNIHGKNNWKKGTIGENVLKFTALLPTGEEITCTPEDDLFYAIIGGIGMLGMFTSITMQMKRIYSGNVWVNAWAEPNLAGMLTALDEYKDYDYDVGWIDCTSDGAGLGRGQMHAAEYLAPNEDPNAVQTMRVDAQILPDTMFGIVPKSIIHLFMQPFMNNLGVWMVNTAKYTMNRTLGNHKRYQQSHVAFNFLLDYVPNWEKAYGSGGLIQYQCFIPKETALDAFSEIIRLGKKRGLPNYLGVLKRHRPDKFLLTHAVDGFSFAQDYRVTRGNRTRLEKLTAELDRVVLEAGGRFYFAKDSTLSRDTVHQYLGQERIEKFRALKGQYDPDGILESDLYRRCFE
ncbi:MAG: FAD-binding oxidoreductase [Anaerolineales bacterium]|nr:FAD-binding oxidoreductase [Anaerolineales bacterium]